MKRRLSKGEATATAASSTTELPWTGERLVPSQTGQIAAEHLHRYAIACALAHGKDVLDIACGEGYGTALLGRTAHSVVGVDIDLESVQHASRKYGSSKIRFLPGDCRAIPLADASVDLVVSFETIEHIQQHDDFLDEVRRVLRRGGRFMVSTPDKQNYGDTRETDNPFHVRELSFVEFRDVLTARFKRVRFLGQRFAAGSVVLGHDSVKPLKLEMFTGNYQGTEGSSELVAPTYLLAVCADGPLPPLAEGMFEFRDAPPHHMPRPEFVAQVFGGDGNGYSAARAITQAIIPGAWQTIRFEHVERVHPDGQYRLRVDPVNAAAFVELTSLRVIRDADKAVIYSAQSADEFATVEFSGNMLAHSVDRRLVLLARDADPQIYLPPLGNFRGRGSYSLELTFRLETTFAGIVQSHHDLLTRNRELAEMVERWRTQAERLESAEAAWGRSHADLRAALESSRVDSGRLESQLALATSDASRLFAQVEELDRSLVRLEEDSASRQRESAARVEVLNRSLVRLEEDSASQQREFEARVEVLNRTLARREEDSSSQQRELEAQAEESSRWQREFEGLYREAETVRGELRSLRESLSWRLTIPLRSVQRFLAKQRRSLRKRRAEIRELYVRAAVRSHPTRHLTDLVNARFSATVARRELREPFGSGAAPTAPRVSSDKQATSTRSVRSNGRKGQMRVLTLFLRYDTQKYSSALDDVDDLFNRQMPGIERQTIVIDNALPAEHDVEINSHSRLIGGDNSVWEFSGWDKAIAQAGHDLERFDLVHLVTSAFKTLYVRYLDFIDERLLASVVGRAAALGHIDYYAEPVCLFNYPPSQHWLRTSFVFLPPTELRLLGTLVSVGGGARRSLFSGDPADPFCADAPLSPNYREYIRGWLVGGGTGQGTEWHSRFQLSAETLPFFEAKTLTVLNEHLLGLRLRARGCHLVDVVWAATCLARQGELPRRLPAWQLQLAERGIDAVETTGTRP